MVKKPADLAPRVNMVSFAEYVGAPTGGRIECVQGQLRNYKAEYRPGADFYRDFVDALRRGRQDGNDEIALQRAVSRQNLSTRADHYRELRRHWLAMKKYHLPLESVGRAFWEVPNLRVSVAPELALRRGDEVLVVRLWLRNAEPTQDAIRAMQWLLKEKMSQICEGGTAAVLDLRREEMHVVGARSFRRGFGAALQLDAQAMGELWQQFARTA